MIAADSYLAAGGKCWPLLCPPEKGGRKIDS